MVLLYSQKIKVSAKQGYLSVAVLPCILHLGFMAATAFFVMHVQAFSCHFEGPRSSSEGFGFVLLQSSFHILFINIFGDIVHPFFSWRIVPSNVWKRCHCCSLVCSFRIFKLALQAVVGGAMCCICIFVPFIAFQAYGYNNLCLGHLPSDVRPWCKARVPLLYNYIQSHYWLLLVSYPSPPLYWFASYIMKSRGIGKRWGYIVWAYSAAYILLGSLLFSNFYPFT
ncbi:unnamed protein product [Malus baccata var. baccata]